MPVVAMRSTHRYPIHPQSQRSPFSAVTRTQPFLQLQIGVSKVPSSRGGGEAEWEWRKLGRGLAPRVGAGASALAGPEHAEPIGEGPSFQRQSQQMTRTGESSKTD